MPETILHVLLVSATPARTWCSDYIERHARDYLTSVLLISATLDLSLLDRLKEDIGFMTYIFELAECV